jgi:hypothetical protein
VCADAITLRSRFRVMGGMISSVSGVTLLLLRPWMIFRPSVHVRVVPMEMMHTGFKQQNHIRGPPLQLRPEEVTLLLEQGVLYAASCFLQCRRLVMCMALPTRPTNVQELFSSLASGLKPREGSGGNVLYQIRPMMRAFQRTGLVVTTRHPGRLRSSDRNP